MPTALFRLVGYKVSNERINDEMRRARNEVLVATVKIFLEELRKTTRNLSTGQFSVSRFETEVVIIYTVVLILDILNVCLIDIAIYWFDCFILGEPISFRHKLTDYREEPRHRFCSSLRALHRAFISTSKYVTSPHDENINGAKYTKF
jgi:hypothetical protein